jgi:hypothetical protein
MSEQYLAAGHGHFLYSGLPRHQNHSSLLWNTMIHHDISLTSGPTTRRLNPVHIFTSCLFKINFVVVTIIIIIIIIIISLYRLALIKQKIYKENFPVGVIIAFNLVLYVIII